MKKLISYLLFGIITTISLYAFSKRGKFTFQQDELTPIWWDFNGTSLQMSINTYYTPDPNNSPDCPPSGGLVYCEIYALIDENSDPDDPKPDLSTISNARMKF